MVALGGHALGGHLADSCIRRWSGVWCRSHWKLMLEIQPNMPPSPQFSATRFNHLTIQGFRRLYDVKFPLHPLCVMIGANGTGKTSVLEVMSLLANSAQGKLSTS